MLMYSRCLKRSNLFDRSLWLLLIALAGAWLATGCAGELADDASTLTTDNPNDSTDSARDPSNQNEPEAPDANRWETSKALETTFSANLPGFVLDPTFGKQGILKTCPSYNDADCPALLATARQADGKLLLLIQRTDIHGEYHDVWRLTKDGAFDTNFGAGGVIRSVITSNTDTIVSSSIAIQGNLGIIIAANIGDDIVKVRRVTYAGKIDASFAQVTVDLPSRYINGRTQPLQLAVQSDHKVLVLGKFENIWAFRLWPNGSRDLGFGSNGIVTPIGPFNFPLTTSQILFSEANGQRRIILLGLNSAGSEDDLVMWRLLDNGSMDNTFDGDGFKGFSAYYPEMVTAVRTAVRTTTGSIFVLADVGDGTHVWPTHTAVVKLTSSGELDRSYGNNGWFHYSSPFGRNTEDTRTVALDPAGNLVIGGTLDVSQTSSQGLLLRVSSTGKSYTTYRSPTFHSIQKIYVPADGNVTAFGWSFDWNIVAARFKPTSQ